MAITSAYDDARQFAATDVSGGQCRISRSRDGSFALGFYLPGQQQETHVEGPLRYRALRSTNLGELVTYAKRKGFKILGGLA